MTPELKSFIEDEYRRRIWKIQTEKNERSNQFTKDNKNRTIIEIKEKFANVLTGIGEMAQYIDQHPKLEFGYELEGMVDKRDDGTFEIDIDSIIETYVDYSPEQKEVITTFDNKIRDLYKEQDKLMIRLSLVQDFETIQTILKEYDIEL